MGKIRVMTKEAYVEGFIQSHFRVSEMLRMTSLMDSKGRPEMNPACRIVVTIPVHYRENNILQALSQYGTQSLAPDNFEVIALVNGDIRELEASKPYRDMTSNQDNFNFTLIPITSRYQSGELKIGTIRRDLATIALARSQRAGVDHRNLIIVTNDADTTRLDPSYLERVLIRFDQNPELGGLTGFCDYNREVFEKNPFLYCIQRYSDVLEIVYRYKFGHTVFHSANASFRASAYLESGGHKRARLSEGQGLKKAVLGAGHQIAYSRRITVETSARRQIAAINSNTPQANRYQNFGKPSDFNCLYSIHDLDWQDLRFDNGDAREKFKLHLLMELKAIWAQKIVSTHRMVDRKRIENLEDMYRFIDHSAYAEQLVRIKSYMIRAGSMMGLKIRFEDHDLILDCIASFCENGC